MRTVSMFFECRRLSSVGFECDPQLKGIESYAFSDSPLRFITIPRGVEFIDGLTFANVSDVSISIETGNSSFVVKSYSVLDSSNTKFIRYVDQDNHVVIPCHIRVLCRSCFTTCKSISVVSLESGSELKSIESGAFSESCLKSITIPGSVETLCSACFSLCYCLSSVSFESGSHLKRRESKPFSVAALRSITIPPNVEVLCASCFECCLSLSSVAFESNSLARVESMAFAGTDLSRVVLPESVSFVAHDAFPRSCEIRTANPDSCDDSEHPLHRNAAGGQ